MGSRPDGWWRDRPAAMARLVGELADHAEATGEHVAVIFDGPEAALPDTDGRVEVAFASRRGRDAADDDIAARAASDPDPASLTVVTSDAALARRAREAGAGVEGAGRFRNRVRHRGQGEPVGRLGAPPQSSRRS